MLKRLIGCTLIIMSCAAQNFLVEKKRSRREHKRLQDETLQLMTELVEMKSTAISLEAQVQNTLCKRVKDVLNTKGSLKNIKTLNAELKHEKRRLLAQSECQKKLLALLT